MERSSDNTPRSASHLRIDALPDLTLDDRRASENRFSGNSRKSISAEGFAQQLRDEIRPETLVEQILTDRIIAASWTLSQLGQGCLASTRGARFAERSLLRAITSLSRMRDCTEPAFPREDLPEPHQWRSRLVMDSELSDASPVIRGTWITVDQIISRIVEGWTWDDLLRDHPELTTDDIRACLAYTIEDEESR